MPTPSHQDSPVHRILLECTDTYFTQLSAGIQRVVRSVASESVNLAEELNIPCQVVLRRGAQFYATAWRQPSVTKPGTWLAGATSKVSGQPTEGPHGIPGTALSMVSRANRLFCSAKRRMRRWHSRFAGRSVTPSPGDTLVLLDAWWNRDLWPAVEAASRGGARIGVVMYDLLPATHPQFFHAKVHDQFTTCLHLALEHGDYFIGISRAVRDQLYEYAQRHIPQRSWSPNVFRSFRLGATLPATAIQGPVRHELDRILGGNRSRQAYLTVGTIEPRKNQSLLLDAFDQIWHHYPNTHLVIVGRVGWLCEALLDRIHQHPHYGRTLFLFHDLGDAELEFCYRHAKAFLFASHAEGFGLPVVEALHHQLPVLVSDIPVHREAGGEFCTYFDPQSPEQLARLVCTIEATGEFPATRSPAQFGLPDWTQSTREFLGQCLQGCNHKLSEDPRRGQPDDRRDSTDGSCQRAA